MKIHNQSSTKTVIHNDDGVMFTIAPMEVLAVPTSVGQAILSAWSDCKPLKFEGEKVMQEPWETKTGPAWEAAKKEHRIDLSKQKVSTGPKRPPVVEPPVPDDAKDPVTGALDRARGNTHLCTYCNEEFGQVTALRKHQAKSHNV